MQCSQLRTLILTVLLAIALLIASAFSHYRNSNIGEIPAQAVETTYTTSEPTAIPTLAYTNGQQQVLAPDWSKITWRNLPPIEEPGWIQIPQNLVNKLGYNPSRRWQAGQTPDQFTFLGDVQDAFHLEAFQLKDISEITGMAMQTLNLNDFGLMNWQTPKSLVKAIPALANFSIDEVAPLRDLLQIAGGGSVGFIGQLLHQNPTFANLPLGKLGLKQYDLQSIPDLDQISLGKFTGWQQSAIASIPGLNQVPFNLFPKSILGGVGVVGIADVVWSAAEHGDANVGVNQFVSGTVNKKNQNVPVACTAGKPCAYLELSDPAGANAPLHGKRWASGKIQKVKGGFGVLGKVNNGWEPAGKLVYGPAFKVVMLNANESTGTASFGLYLRFCSRGLIDLGCTPYFVGPIPWIGVKEKGTLIVAGVSTPKMNIPSKYQAEIDALRQQYEPQADENSAFDDCIAGTVSGDAVNQAIAAATLEASSTCMAGTNTGKPGEANTRILSSIKKLGNFSSSSVPGTDGGANACMWAVNHILKDAGYAPLANDTLAVRAGQNALENGRGQRINIANAQPGDIVLVDKGGSSQHIGFCLNQGCTQTISNSSSRGSFSFRGNSNFSYPGSPYNGSTPQIYRLRK